MSSGANTAKTGQTPNDYYPPRFVNGKPRWGNQTDSGQNRLGPSPTRAIERARTYPGIARAMADQWYPAISTARLARLDRARTYLRLFLARSGVLSLTPMEPQNDHDTEGTTAPVLAHLP